MLPSACTNIDHVPVRAGQDNSAATVAPRNTHETVADCIVGRAYAAISGTAEATISVMRNHRPLSIAVSGERHLGISAIQSDLADTPALDVLLRGSSVLSNDLRLERRWPEFTRRATADTEVLSMFVVPLGREQRVVAALSFYATKPLAFDEAAIEAGLLLADDAGICSAAASNRDRAANLEIALRNTREIGMATGILMGLQQITSQQAFHLLRMESERTNRKLAEIASEVVETGALNARPRDPRSLGRAFLNPPW